MEGGLFLSKDGGGLASRTNKFLNSRFTNPINPKDGFASSDHKDIRTRYILEFLVPIFYLEKPI